MKLKLLTIALLFIISNLSGQTSINLNPQMNNPLPPSPNASALQKFGNIPIGPSTGIPAINIPVYQYENKNSGMSLAVSLDYHAGGVKVDEVASNIGLGWALNAGGLVSRVMKGIPDECSDGFLNTPYFSGASGNDPANAPSFKPFVKANNRQLDIEADLFSYNFNGRSGRFCYGRNGDILMIDDSKIKVEKTVSLVQTGTSYESMITKFILTDESGTKYVFEALEKTENPSSAFHATFCSSWYLTSITSTSGQDNILFTYNDVTISEYAVSLVNTLASDIYPNSSWTNNGAISSYSQQMQRLYGKRLNTISLPNGINLKFFYNASPRTDLPNDYLLDRIVIQNVSSQKAKGFQLVQDYSLSQRATLLKVVPFAGMNMELQDPPYQFFYHPGLPARLSNRQDHWGYPLSRIFSGVSDYERIPREIFASNIGGKFELPGINRDTDEGCKAGTLYKIIYPTGGRTEFELEPNQAENGWLNQNFSVVVNDPLYQDRIENFSLGVSNGTPAQQDGYFTFTGEPDTPTHFTLMLQPTSTSGISGGSYMIRVEIIPNSGSNPGALISQDFTTPLIQSSATFSIANLVKNATYTVRFYFPFESTESYYASAQLTWKEKQPQTQHTEYYSHSQPYVGGLRVKKKLDYDGHSTNPSSIHEYEYLLENGHSSGVLATYPTYTYTTRYRGALNNEVSNGLLYIPGSPLIILRQSSSAHEIVYTNGNPVTYSRVVEHIKGSASNAGKIERFFTTNATGNSSNFPFVPATNLTWLYGLLEKEQVYNSAGDLLKKTVNEYTQKSSPTYSTQSVLENFTSFSIAPVMFNVPDEFINVQQESPYSVNVSNYPPVWFLYNEYRPAGGRSELKSTSTTIYDPATGQGLVTMASNEYDPDYLYLKKRTVVNSKNQIVSEVYTYPADKVALGQNEPYQEMLNRNMINLVVEDEKRLDDVKQTKSFLTYTRYWAANPSLILPITVHSQYMNSAPEVRFRYASYDDKGNPLSLGQESGTKVNYVWAYNRQYPVAEIKNADYSTVENALGGALAISTFGNQLFPSDIDVKNFLSPLFSNGALANAQITLYTHDPLVGVTSQTDPAGRTTYYEYDAFGRLAVVKDQNSRVLKKFDYKYASQ